METDRALKDTVSFLRERFGDAPETVVVLGSGWNSVVGFVDIDDSVSFSDIPGFVDTTVRGHEGRLVISNGSGTKIAFLQGRVHYYEGKGMLPVVYPVLSMAYWGVKKAIFTNAAGGISDFLSPGDLVVIKDHISLFCPNPLIGVEESFIDMVDCYDSNFRELFRSIALEAGFRVYEGVYVYLTGPSFETPAEIRVLRSFGADVVGMSTVPEVIVARKYGLEVGAISFVSNMAASEGIKVKHEDVLAIISKNSDRLAKVLLTVLKELSDR